MLEYPEAVCLSKQMEEIITGKRIKDVTLVRSEKLERWGFVTQSEQEFRSKLTGMTITGIENRSYYIYINTDSEYTLILGEFDGKIIYHPSADKIPPKAYLVLEFQDNTYLSASVKLWGLMKVFGREEKKQHIAGVENKGVEPLSPLLTIENFRQFNNGNEIVKKANVKKYITSGAYVIGLGNGYLQEILFRAKLHPGRKTGNLTDIEQLNFYNSIIEVVKEAINKGGRSTERDLFDKPGEFISRLNKDTVNTPCPDCGALIVKFQFEGGACYICPECQKP
jgi:formamidopyrimidine-DNA glycosylase